MPGGGLMLGWPRGTPLFCARAQGVLGLSPRERARRGGFTFWTYFYRLERLKHELVHFLELPASQVLPPSVREQPLRPDTNPIPARACRFVSI